MNGGLIAAFLCLSFAYHIRTIFKYRTVIQGCVFFRLRKKINELGVFDKKQKYYVMDFNGFVMLVMGFCGSKARQIKEAYINAFNY
ncbi:TPA: Rha family transcriptional regulator [Providencia alcalifaciens]|nr:Rha family transcriptional regulator [Providencia alcalifaciens]